MQKQTQNFIVDLLGFVVLTGLAVTGVIMKYTLPAGSGGHGRGFRGGRTDEVEQIRTVLSLGRHDWGEIHFWLAVAFIIMVIVHILMHTNWLKCYFRSLSGKKQCMVSDKSSDT